MKRGGGYRIGRATSFPEAAVFFYLSKETAAVWSYSPRFLEGMELDVFLPLERAAVEYDGAEWHRDRRNEERKDRLCRGNGVRLLRIREKGADPAPGEAVWTDPSDAGSLERAIEEASLRLLGRAADADLERDGEAIRRLLEGRSPTVGSSRPWLLAQVSPANPFGPEEVAKLPVNGPETVLWRCFACGADYRAYPGKAAAPLCPRCSRLEDPMGILSERDGPYSEIVVMTEPDRARRERAGRPVPGLRPLAHEGEGLWRRPSGTWASPRSGLWWWRCPSCGYRWVSSEENRMLGDGCPQCGRGWRPCPGFPLHHADMPYVLPPETYGIERMDPPRRSRKEKRPKCQTVLGSFDGRRSGDVLITLITIFTTVH